MDSIMMTILRECVCMRVFFFSITGSPERQCRQQLLLALFERTCGQPVKALVFPSSYKKTTRKLEMVGFV